MLTQASLWVLVPFLNEEAGIRTRFEQLSQLASGWAAGVGSKATFCWIDSGSRDGSVALVTELIAGLEPSLRPRFKLIEANLPDPSVGRALNVAIRGLGPRDFFVVHPVDCLLAHEGWSELFGWLESGEGMAAAFPKSYTSKSVVLSVYGRVLNGLLLRWLHWWVWTNLPCVRRDVLGLDGLETPGFLEDLLLSKRIRQASGGLKSACRAFRSQVLVSSRRYDRDGIAARILLNGWITFLFVSGLASIERLKKMYLKKG